MSYGRIQRSKRGKDCEWGKLFGLNSTDLTGEQLAKIEFGKLIEFIDQDKRAEKIVADKLVSIDIEQVSEVHKVEDLSKLSYFLSKYNECIKNRSVEIDKVAKKTPWANERESYAKWPLLNDANKQEEIRRWIKGKICVVPKDSLDYSWLYRTDVELANRTVSFVMNTGTHKQAMHMIDNIDHNYVYSKYPDIGGKIINWGFQNPGAKLHAIVTSMPKGVYTAILPKMFEQGRHVYFYALCHKATPREYIIKALRGVAGRRTIPRVITPIKSDMLEELPPVTRLNVLETVLSNCGSTMPFIDLTEDKLRHMLFTAVIRHTTRVEAVIRKFISLKEKNKVPNIFE